MDGPSELPILYRLEGPADASGNRLWRRGRIMPKRKHGNHAGNISVKLAIVSYDFDAILYDMGFDPRGCGAG